MFFGQVAGPVTRQPHRAQVLVARVGASPPSATRICKEDILTYNI